MLKIAVLAFFNAPGAASVRTRLRRLFFNSLLVAGYARESLRQSRLERF
jgi:hypothetical protein